MFKFSGYWRSHYKYPSSSRQGEFEGAHLVKAFQKENKVVFESVKGKNESYFVTRLVIDEQDNVATGTWQETTETDGYYKGSTYHGAVQFIIKDDEHLEGKWIGFGRDREINVGPCELTYLGESEPKS